MKIRSIAAGTIAGVAALGALAPFASAAQSGQTDATFTITGGFLEIVVPDDTAGAVSLGTFDEASPLNGASVSGNLGSTTVNDERNSTAGWTVSANSSDFVHDTVVTEVVGGANVHISIDPTDVVSEALNGGAPSTTLFVPDTDGTNGDGNLANAGGAIGSAPTANITTIVNGLIAGLGLGDPLPSANNSVTYDPTIQVSIPADTLEGTYVGTIQQTVA